MTFEPGRTVARLAIVGLVALLERRLQHGAPTCRLVGTLQRRRDQREALFCVCPFGRIRRVDDAVDRAACDGQGADKCHPNAVLRSTVEGAFRSC